MNAYELYIYGTEEPLIVEAGSVMFNVTSVDFFKGLNNSGELIAQFTRDRVVGYIKR